MTTSQNSNHPSSWPDEGYGAYIAVIRCANNKFGVLFERAIRFRCKARDCQRGPGSVVFHYFSRETGELLETRVGPYRNPRGVLEE